MRTPRYAGRRQGRKAASAAGLAMALLSTALIAQEAPSPYPPAYPPPTYPPPASAPSDPPVYSTPAYPPAPHDPSTQPYPPPTYPPTGQSPMQPAYPPPAGQPFPQGVPGYVVPQPQAAPAGGSMRQFFATSIAVLAQATGTTLVAGLTQAITGGLNDWFARKTKASQGSSPSGTFAATQGAQVYAPTVYPAPTGTTQPESSPSPAYPSGSSAGPPAYTPPPAYPASPSYSPPAGTPSPAYMPPEFGSATVYAPAPAYAAPAFFDAQTGASVAPDPLFTTRPDGEPSLLAGLAYEIHAQFQGGGTTPVNPATHAFATGDRFIVLYRPTLPGRMDVYNINPLGVQTQIDSVEIAAAQLATLGPYEFTATRGEDRLRLVLTPCSTPALLARTRDIVRVEPAAMAPSSDFSLAACTPATRSAATRPVTRDIRKVAVEDYTGFALDPVSVQERSSGELAPREVTIVFRHQ